MAHKTLLFTFILYCLCAFYSLSSPPAYAQMQATTYPFKLCNCGRILSFPKKPESIVTVGQNSTEILYALGLADKIKGTSLWYSPVLEPFTEIDKKIKKIALNEPSLESILALHPDMVANHLEWAIGPLGSVASYKQFDLFHVPVYTAPADCSYKDNKRKADGYRHQPFTMSMIYREIDELAQIFDVRQRGQDLIRLLKQREEIARQKVKQSVKKPLNVLFWYSSAKERGAPYVAGAYGAPAYICRQLGLQNIVHSQSEWPVMGWETIAQANPDFIIIADMTRHRYPMDSAQAKYDFLKNNILTKHMTAVKNNHIFILDAQSMNPTIRIIDGIEKLSQALAQKS